jgi:hypothetical protein
LDTSRHLPYTQDNLLIIWGIYLSPPKGISYLFNCSVSPLLCIRPDFPPSVCLQREISISNNGSLCRIRDDTPGSVSFQHGTRRL